MDFENVLACLENAEKREQLIAKLRREGPNSSSFLQLQNVMVALKMHKPPRGIDEKTILQHTFKFMEPEECFQNFRLVCKPWKDAVETIRFNQFIGPDIFSLIDEKITTFGLPIPIYFQKYLKAFRKLYFPMYLLDSTNGNELSLLTLSNMQKLNNIYLDSHYECLVSDTVDPFIFEILKNSRETLQIAQISRFPIPNVCFPKLKVLKLVIGQDIDLTDFKVYFPQVLENMERIETIQIDLCDDYQEVCEYIAQHYSDHCVSGFPGIFTKNLLDLVPVKIVTSVRNLESGLNNHKFLSEIRYAHVHGYVDYPMCCGWENYQNYFDQCTNLEAIQIGPFHFVDDVLSKSLESNNKKIWEERISYFKKRGIRIVGRNEINYNDALKTKLAKEAGVTWKFDFF